MTDDVLLERDFESAAVAVNRQLDTHDIAGGEVEVWLFLDKAERDALERELSARGLHARVRSALKPLLHFFLEEADLAGIRRVEVRYPVHPACVEPRFRLEAYPLARMLGEGVELTFTPQSVAADAERANLYYDVRLHGDSGERQHRVFAPNVVRTDFLGQIVCRPSAWLRLTGDAPVDEPLHTAFVTIFDAIMEAVVGRDWGTSEPYFDRLVARVDLPGIERDLGVGDEVVSTAEALHEDLYFSMLEFFQRHSGRELGSRGLQPGQIVPEIRHVAGGGKAHVRLMVEQTTATTGTNGVDENAGQGLDAEALARVDGPLSLADIHASLMMLGGQTFSFATRQGRAAAGTYLAGTKPAVFISGAQHANETTGVIGALRAVNALRAEPGAHLALVPVKNPDGYALNETLRRINPRHMHHAARYTALGDDLYYREHAPWFARAAMDHAFAVSGARLHLNLHGYPSHEWIRPCTGYLPRGFELWNIPKGFFLILRHRPKHEEIAMAMLHAVIADLAGNDALMAYNRVQLDAYRQHAGQLPFKVLGNVPYMASEDVASPCDVTLVTEFPDETVYGADYNLGHDVQMQTAIAATRWWWSNMK